MQFYDFHDVRDSLLYLLDFYDFHNSGVEFHDFSDFRFSLYGILRFS